MGGAWGLVNAALAYAGWLGEEPDPAHLRRLLWLNAGLDILYLLAGLFLLRQKNPLFRGFGLAVLFQGLFLLGFDLWHALQI
ncbi:hypothetical protein DV704_03535 [Meiothermus sp. QL-1]|nr:hypothetical protein DV704_03535 [Meiothermus sp. QL-1]